MLHHLKMFLIIVSFITFIIIGPSFKVCIAIPLSLHHIVTIRASSSNPLWHELKGRNTQCVPHNLHQRAPCDAGECENVKQQQMQNICDLFRDFPAFFHCSFLHYFFLCSSFASCCCYLCLISCCLAFTVTTILWIMFYHWHFRIFILLLM